MISRNLYLALWAVLSRPMRSTMMMSTLAAGTTAVVLASAILLGYRAEAERVAFGAYARSLVITENWTNQDRYGAPRLSDMDALRTELGSSVEAHAAWRISRTQASRDTRHVELNLYGVQGDYRIEADMALAAGRVMSDRETDGEERICMLGAGSYARLFPLGLVGMQTITVNGMNCRVIGAFQPANTRTADRYTDAVIVPFRTAARYFEYPRHLAPDEASQLTLILTPDSSLYQSRSTADRVLRRRHGVPLTQPPPFELGDPSASLQAVNAQRRTLARLLMAVAATSLIAGSAGYIAAAMSATEARRRDFALQSISGAKRIDILVQVILEGTLIGAGGAAIAIALAYIVGRTLANLAYIPVAFNASTSITAVITGLLAGTVAALIPAWRAANGLPAGVARHQ